MVAPLQFAGNTVTLPLANGPAPAVPGACTRKITLPSVIPDNTVLPLGPNCPSMAPDGEFKCSSTLFGADHATPIWGDWLPHVEAFSGESANSVLPES